jgi:hypothetical protein
MDIDLDNMVFQQLPPPRWSREQQAFIAWLALPKRNRVPKTEIALAGKLGVDRNTLYNWRNLPALQAEVKKLCRTLMGSRLPDVLAALERKAIDGSAPHQKLYLELLGMLGPGRESPASEGGGVKILVGVDLDKVGQPQPKGNERARGNLDSPPGH